jgi:ATP-dependent RNA helicase DeaD
VNLGTADGLGPGSIATAMEDAGAPLGKMVRAELRPTFAYVFVAEDDVAAFEALNGKQQGTKTLRVERSKPRTERESTPRPPPSPDAGPGEVKLWTNLGMDDGMDEAKMPAALEAAGAPAGKVLRMELRPTYAYVFVADEDAAGFEATHGKPHGDRTLKVERAKRK